MVSMKWTKWILCAALASPSPLHAQATPYLPVDDIAYHYIDALMARGSLPSLSALERPYTVGDVRAAADTALARGPSRAMRDFLVTLEAALQRYELRKPGEPASDSLPFRAKATFDIYATGETSGRHELMLADANSYVEPGSAGYFVFGAGNLAGSVRAILDNTLNHDPDFTGKKDRRIGGREQDG
jgi:hypothetical protein